MVFFHPGAFKCLWKALTPETRESAVGSYRSRAIGGKLNPGDKLKANMGAVKNVIVNLAALKVLTSAADSCLVPPPSNHCFIFITAE